MQEKRAAGDRDGREGVKEEKGMVYLERDGREVWVEEKDQKEGIKKVGCQRLTKWYGIVGFCFSFY